MVLKSDQEESMIALTKAVAIRRRAPIVNIESPVKAFQANGNAERAVRTWAAQQRTVMHHQEYRLHHKILIHSALLTWLVAWSAQVICRYRTRRVAVPVTRTLPDTRVFNRSPYSVRG